MPPDPHFKSDSGSGYSFTYDAADEDQPARTIIESVAWVSGVEALSLEPLHHSVDTECLNRLFGPDDAGDFYRSATQTIVANQCLTFEYEGYTLAVTSDRIHVEE